MADEHRFFKFLRSMKLAVSLLVLLVLVSVPSTLIPQKQNPGFYIERYGEIGAMSIRSLGMDDVFVSPFFLAIAALFFLNLGYCSLWRFSRELRKKGTGRHGPDVLHLGLLLFMAGAFVSGIASNDTQVIWMDEGDEIILPRGGSFTLQAFESEYYPDGRPRSWTSRGIYSNVEGKNEEVAISVNSPARIEGIKIYQNSFRPKFSLELIPRPGSGAPDWLEEGYVYANKAFTSIRILEDASWFAVFLDSTGEPYSYIKGDPIGDAFVAGFSSRDITGLRLSQDPGVPIVFASFIPIALGLMLIIFEKRKSL